MTFQSFLNGTPTNLQGPLAHGVSDTTITPFINPSLPNPYSISNTTKITIAAGLQGSTSGSTEVASSISLFPSVPEPASMIVWSVVACAVGLPKLLRRR